MTELPLRPIWCVVDDVSGLVRISFDTKEEAEKEAARGGRRVVEYVPRDDSEARAAWDRCYTMACLSFTRGAPVLTFDEWRASRQ